MWACTRIYRDSILMKFAIIQIKYIDNNYDKFHEEP